MDWSTLSSVISALASAITAGATYEIARYTKELKIENQRLRKLSEDEPRISVYSIPKSTEIVVTNLSKEPIICELFLATPEKLPSPYDKKLLDKVILNGLEKVYNDVETPFKIIKPFDSVWIDLSDFFGLVNFEDTSILKTKEDIIKEKVNKRKELKLPFCYIKGEIIDRYRIYVLFHYPGSSGYSYLIENIMCNGLAYPEVERLYLVDQLPTTKGFKLLKENRREFLSKESLKELENKLKKK